MTEFPLVEQTVRLIERVYDALQAYDPYDQSEFDCDCGSCQHVRRLYSLIDILEARALRRAGGDYSIVRHYEEF